MMQSARNAVCVARLVKLGNLVLVRNVLKTLYELPLRESGPAASNRA